ncbi:MAG: helix-turn-helix domain-containing protein [Planctomycetota bacterium]|nr:helix-turn-helix domain-containing protein [Planctomycetota bacterium]
MPRSPKRSPCPVACTLDLLGDKWTLLVVRDLFCGKSRFRDFLDSPEGIATNILSERLARLTKSGLVETFASPAGQGRAEYRLTKRGKSLGPVLESVKDWGLANIPGTEARLQPKV